MPGLLTILHGEIGDKCVNVTPDLSPNIPPVEGDRIELQEVLINLILNACDSLVKVEFTKGISCHHENFIRCIRD